MADIARLFLEGARPLPTRIPPQRRAPQPSSPVAPSAPPAPMPSTQTSETLAAATTVLGLASGVNQAASWRLLVQAAQGLAQEQSTAVALVGLLPNGDKTSFIVDVVGVESMEELPVVRTAQEAGSDNLAVTDMQVARALHRLRPAVGLWIICAPPCTARTFPAIASILHQWLLACPTDNDGLISGYQFLKQSWVSAGGKDGRVVPSVYLLSEDYAQSAVVHKRLRKAVQEFLGADLALAGAGPSHRGTGGGGDEPIRVLSVAYHGPTDALWAAVLDELCPMSGNDESFPPTEVESALDHVEDQAATVVRQSVTASTFALDHLAQVLDPEERAALAAGFEEPAVAPRHTPRPAPTPTVAPRPAPVVQSVSAEPPAPAHRAAAASLRAAIDVMSQIPPTPAPAPAAESKIENGGGQKSKIANSNSLRAFDLGVHQDRTAQWDAVERSIWDLSPRSALLDAKPPMSWASETCISIDAQGRVNVWALYKDGASWFALREWANEHRNLLALTRRDLIVDKAAEVAVHIVLPLDDPRPASEAAESESIVKMLMRAPTQNLHLYRLRLVQWNERRGLMVVPIA
jgi:hypothetical protein